MIRARPGQLLLCLEVFQHGADTEPLAFSGQAQGFKPTGAITMPRESTMRRCGEPAEESAFAGRFAMNELPTIRPEQRIDGPVPGDDPILAIVSQNKGRVTGLVRYEIFSRLKRA